nr:nucleotide-binding alpha-beta plait domain-containing protein [Tanacetum cinerariifolium]
MEYIICHFFNGADSNEKKMMWVRWSRVLASKEKGGLSVSSYYALDRALMFKWVWQFPNDGSSLWARVIKSMHGVDGRIGKSTKSYHPFAWVDIVNEVNKLKSQGLDLLSLMKKKVGNEKETSFWDDAWRGDIIFKYRFPRVYALETNKMITVDTKLAHENLGCSLRRFSRDGAKMMQYSELMVNLNGIQLYMMQDRWPWSLKGSGNFFVASVRKGLDLQSILCLNFDKEVESTSHIFFGCSMARDLSRKIASWWDICYLEFPSYEEWLVWLLNLRIHSRYKELLAMVNMRSLRSKEDDVQKISSSVFVTNFPEQFSAKDLWNTFKVYGHVVDTYIPDRRSKIGKRSGFIRFIKVFDMEPLVNNLCTVWIGKLKLHANVARYQRDSRKNNYQRLNKGMNVSNGGGIKNGGVLNSSVNSYANVMKKPTGVKETIDGTPTMVLDESCLNNEEFSLCLLGKVTKFASLTNLKVVLAKEGFGNIELKYMGAHKEFVIEERVIWVKIEGVPCKWWSKNTFNRIASRWGNLLNAKELEEGGYHSNRLCIRTKINMAIVESFKMVYHGKTCWVRVIEVPGWVLDFEDDCDDDDFESNDGTQVAEGPGESSKDPFGVYELLNKKKKVTNNEGESQNSPTYPTGFTPNDNAKDNINTSNVDPVDRGHNGDKEEGEFVVSQNQDRNDTDVYVNESTCSWHFNKSTGPRTGGSIIQLIEDLVSVGQTMGYDMTRCMYNMENIIESQGVAGGDFNEVQDSSERFGLVFNKHGAKLFNDFIAKAGLTEVPLGGCIFTWCHKTASNMSKLDRFLVSDSLLCNCPRISSVTLDRFLFDHRPILLRESIYDYGPIPFKFYHYWFEIDGFDKLMKDSWNEIHVVDNNAYVRFMKKLKLLKERIKAWNSSYRELTNCRKNTLKTELINLDSVLDRGEGIDTDVTRRSDVVRILQDIEKTEAMEVAQKAKIKWAAVDLEWEVSKEEVKRAVWDCGIDKAPGTDGFTFRFYRRFWNLINCDVVKAVKWFFLHERIPSGGNSSFITLIPKVSNANMTRWVKEVPIKINILAWKVSNDNLPTRFYLSRRGIDIGSIVYPMCNNMVESSRHLFFSCDLSNQLMSKISRWWDLRHQEINYYEEWTDWMLSIRLPYNLKNVFEGVCYIVWWFIWDWRNQAIFGPGFRTKSIMFDDNVSRMESDFYKNCFMACKLVFQALCAPGLSRQVNGVQKDKADVIIFLQIEATLVGYGSHLSPPPTITQNQTTTAYVTWHRKYSLQYGTLMEPTIVPLVLLATTSKALWDTLATTTGHRHNRNQSRPIRYANGASDSNRPNKKMKMKKIKVTIKKKVDEYTPPYLGNLDLLLLLHLHLHLLVREVGVGVVGGAVRVANMQTLITLRVGVAKKRKKRFI